MPLKNNGPIPSHLKKLKPKEANIGITRKNVYKQIAGSVKTRIAILLSFIFIKYVLLSNYVL
jgi:hypothetical protein